MTILFKILALNKSNFKLLKVFLISLVLVSKVYSADEIYIVKKGDTLYSISKKYNVSQNLIKSFNNLSSNQIYINQKLKIPKAENTFKSVDSKNYLVLRGETLKELSQRYKLNINQLVAWNNLRDFEVREGEQIRLEKPDFLNPYIVEKGDSLLSLAKTYDTTVETIVKVNMLKSKNIFVGEKLFIKKADKLYAFHFVEWGDTLEKISYIHNIDKSLILKLNGEKARNLKAGTLLEIHKQSPIKEEKGGGEVKVSTRVSLVSESELIVHSVKRGETLYSIARQYNVLIENLKKWNNLAKEAIFVGQELKIYLKKDTPILENKTPIIAKNENLPINSIKSTKKNFEQVKENFKRKNNTFSSSSLVVLDPNIPIFEHSGDFYYWYKPKKTFQPNSSYSENWPSPLNAYKKGIQLFNSFKKLVEESGFKNNKLQDKLIIIDPGHGGLDPGTIVKQKDGLGRDVYVVEDEYVYDIALRLYVNLKQYRANVELTILAPDHLIRDTVDAHNTFVNVKNEVYNNYELNKNDTAELWIKGTKEGLKKRITVTNNLLKSYPKIKRDNIIFLSLHADNNPNFKKGMGVLYQEDESSADLHSKAVALKMLPFLRPGAYVKSQNLHVLRNNSIRKKLLIEVRNLAYKDEVWGIRYAQLRQQDANFIADAILKIFE